jgi:hypothetical protein
MKSALLIGLLASPAVQPTMAAHVDHPYPATRPIHKGSWPGPTQKLPGPDPMTSQLVDDYFTYLNWRLINVQRSALLNFACIFTQAIEWALRMTGATPKSHARSNYH